MDGSFAGLGIFIFLAVAVWSRSQAAGRKAQARYALLAKAAEQNAEGAKLVLDFLREEEAKQKIDKSERVRRETIQAGIVITMAGVAAAVYMFFAFPGDHERVWPTGLFLVFFGLAGIVMGYFNKPKAK